MSNQSTRDQHGRQRFHGAFTGGFSAGYHNTVGSVGGFQPKSFTSSRSSTGQGSRFSHNAEDYMDEEDFGEFGIAPKKIRVSSTYSDVQSGPSTLPVRQACPGPSIGEKILNHSTRRFLLKRNEVDCLVENLNKYLRINHSNFHGLGYKPLRPQACASGVLTAEGSFSNPLTATLKDGKRLQITGEAFGSGVQDDDDEQLNHFDAYGYDDKRFYRESKVKSSQNYDKLRETSHSSTLYEDDILPGFTSAKCNNVIGVCDKDISDYKPPVIPDSWIPPVRKFDLIQKKKIARTETNLKEFKSVQFDKKFTAASSSSSVLISNTESKAGLISYSELKADNASQPQETPTTSCEKQESASMERLELDWFPCSLLCKHFNVPNPHPLCPPPELKQSITEEPIEAPNSIGRASSSKFQPMPLELRKLVFNITFSKQEDFVDLESSPDQEDTPQVEVQSTPRINLTPLVPLRKPSPLPPLPRQQSDSSESEPDVIVMEPISKQPEVILISSSTSGSSTDHSDNEVKSDEKGTGDLYGPPVPPTFTVSRNYKAKRKKEKKKKRKKSKKSSRSER